MGVRIRMDAKLDLNVGATVSRFNPRYKMAQQRLDSEVLRTTEPYVPFRTGALARSGPASTQLGSGVVTYNTPYARKLYYGGQNLNRTHHPQASAQWFEKAKAAHREEWVRVVEETVKG